VNHLRLTVIAATLAAAGSAGAQPGAEPPATAAAALEAPPAAAVSIALDPLFAVSGVAGEYERWLGRWSWSVGGGLASHAGGDYGSTTVAAGAEVRYWFKRDAIWSQVAPGSMVGWFAGARLDAAAIRTVDRMDDRALPTTLAFEATVRGGYRLAPWRRLVVTPSLGIGARTDVVPGSSVPTWRTGVVQSQLAIGWLF
jgi:hypothetical protein